MCCTSVRSLFRNLRLAGTLKNRSRTSTVVPTGCDAGTTLLTVPLSADTFAPMAASRARDMSCMRDTDAMLGNASPRKPSVATRSRSSMHVSLLVACRDSASASSCAAMPLPSSRMRQRPTPPWAISISMRRAPASRLFSNNSLTTDAGRSITSPAAI
jgi:hypothetical protein